MDRNKNYYEYVFSNGEVHVMTPVEAHKYAYRFMVDILRGPGYDNGKRERFTGWGWHDSLNMTFKGPNDYRSYLKEHGLVEAGINDCPKEGTFKTPTWTPELIDKAINYHGLKIGDVLADALLAGELDWPDPNGGEMSEDEQEY